MNGGLSRLNVQIVVNRWIGVDKGYLGDFSYQSHSDFYSEYVELDIDPFEYEGTTRDRFTEILATQPSENQAKILLGVLERFPLESEIAPKTRTADLESRIRAWASALQAGAGINATMKFSAVTVARAFDEAEELLRSGRAVSALDRTFTAIHGYLKGVAVHLDIQVSNTDSITSIFKKVRKSVDSTIHTRPAETTRILNTSASILDSLMTLRNNASLAHPNSELLSEDEARLAVNISRSLLAYYSSVFGHLFDQSQSESL